MSRTAEVRRTIDPWVYIAPGRSLVGFSPTINRQTLRASSGEHREVFGEAREE